MALANKLVEKISEFIRLKGEKIKLDIIAKVSKILALFVTFLIISMFGVFFILFLSFALSEFLNTVLNSEFYGYLITAGIYLLMLIIVAIIFRSHKMQKWLESQFVSFGEDINDIENE